MSNGPQNRPVHGHHKIAAAIFVASLIGSAAMVLSAELIKPERYEHYQSSTPGTYVLFDRETGRAISVEYNSKDPTASFGK